MAKCTVGESINRMDLPEARRGRARWAIPRPFLSRAVPGLPSTWLGVVLAARMTVFTFRSPPLSLSLSTHFYLLFKKEMTLRGLSSPPPISFHPVISSYHLSSPLASRMVNHCFRWRAPCHCQSESHSRLLQVIKKLRRNDCIMFLFSLSLIQLFMFNLFFSTFVKRPLGFSFFFASFCKVAAIHSCHDKDADCPRR